MFQLFFTPLNFFLQQQFTKLFLVFRKKIIISDIFRGSAVLFIFSCILMLDSSWAVIKVQQNFGLRNNLAIVSELIFRKKI